ncbi:MAG: sugar ABC transporter substrate-binding protein [Oscillospiraceae bacterium]|nr:sugar ABC transporter substrate-binding protein [Oscillospiraceae bacterium]
MKMKLILAVVLVVALLAGCATTPAPAPAAPATPAQDAPAQDAPEAPPTDGEVFRVAYIARAQADAFAAWLANAVLEEAANYPNIEVTVFDGQASDSVVNTHIENAIVNQFDVIIVQPHNGEAQRPFVEQAVAAGIHTITTNARIDGIPGSSSVDADPFEQAAVNARVAIDQIPEGANVVVLNGPPGNFHADERRRAWQAEFFDARPDVTIVGEQIANWNIDEAMSFMEDWMIANDRIDAIISMNDNMALGALEAVRGTAFEGLLAYGVDGTAEAVLSIQAGEMTQTTLQSAYDLAELLLQTSYRLLMGLDTEIHVDVGNPIVTIDNVEDFIELHRRAGAIS